MSTIRTEVVAIEDVRPHPNADSLELATIKGWQMAVKKGQYQNGAKVVYFEGGTILPQDMTDKLGVTNYMQNKTDINGDRVLVVGRVKLRGEPSFGLVVDLGEVTWELGTEVSGWYGAKKFFPPVKTTAGDADTDHYQFPAYTDVENMRNFPAILEDGEEVEASEKLHGTNSRVGYVFEIGTPNGLTWMAGSRTLRRKQPEPENNWYPLTLDPVKNMLNCVADNGGMQAVLYGEVFGKGVQNYDYGTNRPEYRAFDLMIDGKYVDRHTFYELCDKFGVKTCPVMYRGPFSIEAIKAVSDGPSQVGGDKSREGVVVRPVVERNHPRVGRVILKYVGDTYLFGKAAQEDYTDQ
jgi:RNA ligase (TIGR02306 family)